MTQHAALKQRYAWNIIYLSSGEVSIPDLIAQSGQRMRGGQNVRLIDVEADAGAGFGLFENLHEYSTARELADALRDNSKQFYGAAIREFLRAIVKVDIDVIKQRWQVHKSNFLKSILPENASSEIQRVATVKTPNIEPSA